MQGGLADGIDLGVIGAHAVIVNHDAAGVVTVFAAGQRAVVAGGDHMAIIDQHAAAMHARTGSALGGKHGQLEKIYIPGGAIGRFRLRAFDNFWLHG